MRPGTADFDAAIKIEPDRALQVAGFYTGAGQFQRAIAAYDGWIAANPRHERLSAALNGRCWTRALAGEKWQTELARSMSYVPNKTTLARVVEDEEATRVMAEGAVYGQATPNSAQWAEVEAQNPIKPYMTAVLRGEDPKKAATAASERITAMLR